MPEEEVISRGMVERIGGEEAVISYTSAATEISKKLRINSHEDGLKYMAEMLFLPDSGIEQTGDTIKVVGHRVVHGGSEFSGTVLVDESVKEQIRKYTPMAPLHNPHNLIGIEIAEKLFPGSRQVAVFDTAFHQTMPAIAYRYAIPEKLYRDCGIRAYGFHGTSHAYVTKMAREFHGGPSQKVISIHLGNGCSITAVKDGKSVDHSLGFAPSNGLIMGTRSGDIDHAIIFYLHRELGYKLDDIQAMLDKKSGMLGLSGYSDLREIEAAAKEGNQQCQLALDMNAYRIKKYIGAYAAAMNGIDMLIFTAGIGENSSLMRDLVCNDLEFLGIELDPDKNNSKSSDIRAIDSDALAVKILVIPTNEEIEIARQAYMLCCKA